MAVLLSSSHRLLILHSLYHPHFKFLNAPDEVQPLIQGAVCNMQHSTERTRKQMNNGTLIPTKYQKECFSKLNRLKPLSLSRVALQC
jgi:hypothetical protein